MRVRWDSGWRVVAAIALLVTALPATAAQAPTVETVARVIDGDTFQLATGERIRVAGIDAPETQRHQAHCAAEVRQGLAAKAQARALLDGRRVQITRTGRSYERTVARVKIGGQDFGQMMIDRGAARPWPRGRPKPDWCSAF
jgi:micrococcal nuclease